ncbi:MAG: hypothetical protein JXN64_01855 [Spirochaetes bacterium]|nr:hypothetical protein [Spirochaetota bacterium]
MEKKKKKSEEIVKSIKLLESVLKTSIDAVQKTRVKKDIKNLRSKLADLYPGSDLKEIENAVYANIMAIPRNDFKSLKHYKHLKNINIEIYSNYKEDSETNEAASIMKFFEERIWVVISDQHTKLDFSNSGERDALYRKLDECNRALKSFCQTIDDIEKIRSSEYINQLHLMRVRHGRLFLFEIHQFFKSVKQFVTNLLANQESGGNMVLNPDDLIKYADYEEYATYENWTVINALKNMLEFLDEALDLINIPNIK